MSSRRFVIVGLDPTGIPGSITKAELLQMFAAATPDNDLGFVINQVAVPDIGTYPELERFLWIKTSTGELYRYDGVSWSLISANAIINDHSIGYKKLDITGGNAGQVLAVNGGPDEFEFKYVNALIGVNQLAVNKLIAEGAGDFVLWCHNGAISWTSTAAIFALLGLGVINPTSLIGAGGSIYGKFLYTNPLGNISWIQFDPATHIPDDSIPSAKLAAVDPLKISAGTEGQILMVVGGKAVWSDVGALDAGTTIAANSGLTPHPSFYTAPVPPSTIPVGGPHNAWSLLSTSGLPATKKWQRFRVDFNIQQLTRYFVAGASYGNNRRFLLSCEFRWINAAGPLISNTVGGIITNSTQTVEIPNITGSSESSAGKSWYAEGPVPIAYQFSATLSILVTMKLQWWDNSVGGGWFSIEDPIHTIPASEYAISWVAEFGNMSATFI